MNILRFVIFFNNMKILKINIYFKTNKNESNNLPFTISCHQSVEPLTASHFQLLDQSIPNPLQYKRGELQSRAVPSK